jgi:hypothetical protein
VVESGLAESTTHGIRLLVFVVVSTICIVAFGDERIFLVLGSMILRLTFQSPVSNCDPGKVLVDPERSFQDVCDTAIQLYSHDPVLVIGKREKFSHLLNMLF